MVSRLLHKLSARRVELLKSPGWHGDGGGLWLRIDKYGSRKWVFTWERNKRRREMGLGGVGDVTLAAARHIADSARQQLQRGLDPIDERYKFRREELLVDADAAIRSQITTFGTFAESYITAREEGWRNSKHRQQWRNTIATHAASLLGKSVDSISTDDIVAVLKPIWRKTPETAGRLRGRLENILDAAMASKHIPSPWENPARWRGNLIHLLPRRPKNSDVKHHAAMPYQDIPAFMEKLRMRQAVAARSLEITILCAARTSETLKMTWEEVDLNKAVWTVPAERMKMGVEHRIPLSKRAIEVLLAMTNTTKRQQGSYVFPGQKAGMPISQMGMTMLLRRMNLGQFTVHGMRSTFRDYMGDMTAHPEAVIEQALAHQVGDETVRAYRRGDAFLKRHAVMEDWARYLNSGPAAAAIADIGPDEGEQLAA
jgi:integrase